MRTLLAQLSLRAGSNRSTSEKWSRRLRSRSCRHSKVASRAWAASQLSWSDVFLTEPQTRSSRCGSEKSRDATANSHHVVQLNLIRKSATAAAVQHLGRIVRENGALVVRKVWESTAGRTNRKRRIESRRYCRGDEGSFWQNLTLAGERGFRQPSMICRGCLGDASLPLINNFAADHGHRSSAS